MEEIFTEIYKQNYWKDDESVSGKGSRVENTLVARTALMSVVGKYAIKTILDIPCGDFNWMKEVPLQVDEYIGADIVQELVDANNSKFAAPGRSFVKLDATRDNLPKVDLIFCRDMLGHLSNSQVKIALHNMKRSGSRYLMATTFPNTFSTDDIRTGQWRPINLDYFFGLPLPIEMINELYEGPNGEFSDKSLGLWRLNNE